MSALDKLKEQASTQLSASSEQLSKIEDLLLALVESQANLSKRLTNVEQEMITRTNALKSSMQTSKVSLPDSLTSDVNAIKETLNAQSATLNALGETVSDRRVVKQSDGSEVSASELEALSMMKTLEASQKTMTTALADLKQTVGNGRTVRIDVNRLSEQAVGVLDQRLARAVEGPVQRVERILDGVEQRVAHIGTQKATEAALEVEKVMGKADELMVSVGRAESRLEALEGRLAWTTVGRICLALVPLFAAIVLVGGLVWGLGSMFGVGPLFGWAWVSFTAASVWWQKALIAAGTLGGAGLFVWVVLRVAQWIYEELR